MGSTIGSSRSSGGSSTQPRDSRHHEHNSGRKTGTATRPAKPSTNSPNRCHSVRAGPLFRRTERRHEAICPDDLLRRGYPVGLSTGRWQQRPQPAVRVVPTRAIKDPVMIDPAATDPLLRPLRSDQHTLLKTIGDAVVASGAWPVYQYVQARMDEAGWDVDEVFGSLPSISGMHLTYSLARRDRGGRDEEPVKLTVAGLAHLEEFSATVRIYLRVLNALGEQRAAAPFEPQQVVTVEVSGPQLVRDLDLEREPLVDLLPELLQGEPATWHGAGHSNDEGWVHRPSSFLRRFRDVDNIDDYLARMRAWILPAPPTPVAQPISPLGVVTAFDYLDVVWRVRFGHKLHHVPSAARAAQLAFDATTAEELDSRLSALGEMFKGLNPRGTKEGSFDRLAAFLATHLPEAAMDRVRQAIETLRLVTHVRNAGQHVGASPQAARALPKLGLSYPITDHQAAWRVVQARVIGALDTIREEVHGTLGRGSEPAAPTGHARQPRRRRPRPIGTQSVQGEDSATSR